MRVNQGSEVRRCARLGRGLGRREGEELCERPKCNLEGFWQPFSIFSQTLFLSNFSDLSRVKTQHVKRACNVKAYKERVLGFQP